MALRSSARAGGSENVVCKVMLGMRGFCARETHKDYPEKNFTLCVWHPGFMDIKFITHDELMTAQHALEMVTFAPVTFEIPRPDWFDSQTKTMRLPESSSLGLLLYAQTENDNKQDCVKMNGAYRRVMLNPRAPAREVGSLRDRP